MVSLNIGFVNSQKLSRIQKRPALNGHFRFGYVISCMDKTTFRYFRVCISLLIRAKPCLKPYQQTFVELTLLYSKKKVAENPPLGETQLRMRGGG